MTRDDGGGRVVGEDADDDDDDDDDDGDGDDDGRDGEDDARTMMMTTTPTTTTTRQSRWRRHQQQQHRWDQRRATFSREASGTKRATNGRGDDGEGGGDDDGGSAAATGRKRRRWEEEERRRRGGPLFAMGDLKTTPMQTPRETCPPSTGAFRIVAKRMSLHEAPGTTSASAGRRRGRRRDSYNNVFDSSVKKRREEMERAGDGGAMDGTTMGAEEETPRSGWGDMSPGEHGGSQYVMSPAREYSQCDSGSEGEMIGASGSARRDDVLRDRAVNGGEGKDRQTTKLYPIFRTGRKTVYLVRHGESTWNAQHSGPGSFEEPNMYDAPLTDLGKKQAKSLGVEFSKIPRDALWITSPLTRAMQTCIIGRRAGFERKAERLKKMKDRQERTPTAVDADDACFDENLDNMNTPLAEDFDVETEFQNWAKKVIVKHELTEQLKTTGDVGRARHHLQEDFPELALALAKIPHDRWWWCDERRGPNCAETRQLSSYEPDKAFRERVERFKSWLFKRPEKVFVVVGHSQFFKVLSKSQRCLRNCEVHEMSL